MRDTRVTIFSGAPLTINTNVTTNGDTLDLKSGIGNYVGDYFEGSPNGYGIRVELLFSSITGTRIDIAIKWQDSDDGSTWYDAGTVLADSNLMTLTTASPNDKYAVPTAFYTARRYARLVVTTTDVSSGSFVLNAWLSDGVTPYVKATMPRI